MAIYSDNTHHDLGEWGKALISSLTKVDVNINGYYVINDVLTEIKQDMPISYYVNDDGDLIAEYIDKPYRNLGSFETYVNELATDISIDKEGYYIISGVKTSIKTKVPKTYSIDTKGHLIVTYADDSTEDLGTLKEALVNGIASVTVDNEGCYVINGVKTSIKTKVPYAYSINTEGHLIVTYIDDTTDDLGLIGDSLANGVSTITISENGNYEINGVETSISATAVYTVTFDAGFSQEVPEQKIKDGYKATKPELERVGYQLNGWLLNGEEWNFISNEVKNDITLVASWTANEYTVKFENEMGSNPSDKKYAYDSEIVLPKLDDLQNYTFDGWYNGDDIVEDGVWSIAKDVTLKAKWSPKIYTITLDPNGGTLEKTQVEVTYGQDYELPVPTNTYGSFKGWFLLGERVTGKDGKPLSKYEYSSNITLTTDWSNEISTAEQLKAISADLGGYYKLVADIDLENEEWIPIGDKEIPFTGLLDGNGYKISNLKISTQREYVGLFGYSAGQIKNLFVEINYSIPAIQQDSYIGGISGYNGGSIDNVSVFGEVTTNNHSAVYKSHTAGIAGVNAGTITNTTNNANVKGLYYTAGISCLVENPTNISFSKCINNGAISGTDYVGGILSISSNYFKLEKCVNNGHISGTTHVAGLIASANSSDKNPLIISQCGNNGKIESSSSDSYTGGLVGYTLYAEVSDSYNNANIDGYYLGGLIGYLYYASFLRVYSAKVNSSKFASGNICYGISSTIGDSVAYGTAKYVFAANASAITNCYYSTGTEEKATKTSVHYDKDFYLNSLFWTEDTWDFYDDKLPTLKWENKKVKANIKNYISRLTEVDDTTAYSYLPDAMEPSYSYNKVTESSINYDFTNKVYVSNIKKQGFGEQWQMVVENIDESIKIAKVFNVINTVLNTVGNALDIYVENHYAEEMEHDFTYDDFTAHFEFKDSKLVLNIELINSVNVSVVGSVKPIINMEYDIETDEKTVYISLGDNYKIKYAIAEDSYNMALTYGITVAGKEVSRTSYLSIDIDENEKLTGHIYEYTSLNDSDKIKACADFYVEDNYVSVVGNKSSGMVGFSGYINELYKADEGRLLGYEVKEELTVAGIKGTYNTLWFNLWDISGINSIRVTDKTDANQSSKSTVDVYLNGSSDLFIPTYNTKLGQKTSRKYDIELRSRFYYVYDSNTGEYIAHEVKVPMMFIQEGDNFTSFSADMANTNGITSSVTLNEDYLNKILEDYDTLIDIFIENKELMNSEGIIAYIES